MTTQAIIFMIVTNLIFISFTAYFFVKVLRTPDKPEPDSFQENDDRNFPRQEE